MQSAMIDARRRMVALAVSYWLPVLLYAGFIFAQSAQSRPAGPSLWLLRLIGDKGLHAIEYAVLGLLCYRAFRHAAGDGAARSALLLAVLASTGYGITDEIHQAFVPLREPDAWDVLADLLGSVLGASAWRGSEARHSTTPALSP